MDILLRYKCLIVGDMDLNNVFKNIRDNALKIFGKDNLYSIIVFGSASRPEEFVEGLSDIDIAFIVRSKKNISETINIFSDTGYRVSPVFLTPNDLKMLVDKGYPLSHLLKNDSKIIYGEDFIRDFWKENKLNITDKTLDYLYRSSLVALSLAAEDYFSKMYRECISHLYHSIRHAFRWLICKEYNVFLTSNKSILDAIKLLKLPAELEDIFKRLINLRREKNFEEKAVLKIFDDTIDRVSKILDLNQYISFNEVLNKLREIKYTYIIIRITAFVENRDLRWMIELYNDSMNRYEEILIK